jgi:hypothetical protein
MIPGTPASNAHCAFMGRNSSAIARVDVYHRRRDLVDVPSICLRRNRVVSVSTPSIAWAMSCLGARTLFKE